MYENSFIICKFLVIIFNKCLFVKHMSKTEETPVEKKIRIFRSLLKSKKSIEESRDAAIRLLSELATVEMFPLTEEQSLQCKISRGKINETLAQNGELLKRVNEAILSL